MDPALIGMWSDGDDGNETWQFKTVADEQKAYHLTIKQPDGNTSEMRAHLVKLKGRLFLDITAESLGESSLSKISD